MNHNISISKEEDLELKKENEPVGAGTMKRGDKLVGLWKPHVLDPMQVADDTRWSSVKACGARYIHTMAPSQQTM